MICKIQVVTRWWAYTEGYPFIFAWLPYIKKKAHFNRNDDRNHFNNIKAYRKNHIFVHKSIIKLNSTYTLWFSPWMHHLHRLITVAFTDQAK